MRLSLWDGVELKVTAIEGYSTFPRDPEWEPHNQMQFPLVPKALIFGGKVLSLCMYLLTPSAWTRCDTRENF